MEIPSASDLLSIEQVGPTIAVTLLGSNNSSKFPWGTLLSEHRINPPLIAALNAALDQALDMPEVGCVVVTGQGKFFSNGLDLKWIDKHPGDAAIAMQGSVERLLVRLLTFPVPTIAAINGHFCAAGAMLGLAFDVRIMRADRGMFFVPAVDLGLVYSQGMIELMKCKTPQSMHRDMILFSVRYDAAALEALGVIDSAVPSEDVWSTAIDRACDLCQGGRFLGGRYRHTLMQTKCKMYKVVVDAFDPNVVEGMGFGEGEWDADGKVVRKTEAGTKHVRNQTASLL